MLNISSSRMLELAFEDEYKSTILVQGQIILKIWLEVKNLFYLFLKPKVLYNEVRDGSELSEMWENAKITETYWHICKYTFKVSQELS